MTDREPIEWGALSDGDKNRAVAACFDDDNLPDWWPYGTDEDGCTYARLPMFVEDDRWSMSLVDAMAKEGWRSHVYTSETGAGGAMFERGDDNNPRAYKFGEAGLIAGEGAHFLNDPRDRRECVAIAALRAKGWEVRT